jgi:hypothetical protein
MAASFERMTACEIKGLPNTFRCVVHLEISTKWLVIENIHKT